MCASIPPIKLESRGCYVCVCVKIGRPPNWWLSDVPSNQPKKRCPPTHIHQGPPRFSFFAGSGLWGPAAPQIELPAAGAAQEAWHGTARSADRKPVGKWIGRRRPNSQCKALLTTKEAGPHLTINKSHITC